MKHWLWFVLLSASAAFGAGSGGVNSAEHLDKPYLILVSIDGFRWDYLERFETPALESLAVAGVRAERMIPVFPTLTFPNHYSIATGLYPANHGLIGNRFLSKDRLRLYSLRDRDAVQDGAWYGGNPIWLAAEKSGMVTAAYFFVGTEAAVDGVSMTYWNAFDASVPGMHRVEQVLDWLSLPAEKRPHFLTLYFEDVDTATHNFGPGSSQSIAAIRRVDGYLAALIEGIAKQPFSAQVYLVVVSDHGQAARRNDAEPFILEHVTSLDDLTVVDHGAAAFVYVQGSDAGRPAAIRDAINASWRHGKAMLRDEVPENWHVTKEAGFAEIIVQADPGYLVYSTAERARARSVGDHGWAPEYEKMHGIFLAAGPRLPKNWRIGAIEAVDVYPLMMEILDLPITTPIDGDRERLKSLLQP